MTDQSKIAKMRSEANRELNGMKFKKATATRNINNCLKLVEVCKGESQINSPLLKQSADSLQSGTRFSKRSGGKHGQISKFIFAYSG